MKLSEQIRQARQKKKMSQAQFAIALGVSTQTVSNWENARNVPSIEVLTQISELTGSPMQSFFCPVATSGLAPDETNLLEVYRSLNANGKRAIAEYAADISSLPKYKN